jgi:predicted GNAT family acetyltransferase
MVTLHEGDLVVGAVLQAPPNPLIASAMPADAAMITAEAVLGVNPELPGVNGHVEAAQAFADAWTKLTGTEYHEVMALRLFELKELRPPVVAGQARLATADDLPLLTRWRELFSHHGPNVWDTARAEAEARRSLDAGDGNILWELDGTPVSYAAVSVPIEGMCRVAPVYTPVEQQGHGYASAATAAASQWALDQDAEHVLLHTDLANAVTNRIYPRIGYRAVHDVVEYAFRNSRIA